MKAKQYIALAQAIKENSTRIDTENATGWSIISAKGFIDDLCDILAAENPGKFDEKKFRELLK